MLAAQTSSSRRQTSCIMHGPARRPGGALASGTGRCECNKSEWDGASGGAMHILGARGAGRGSGELLKAATALWAASAGGGAGVRGGRGGRHLPRAFPPSRQLEQ